MKPSQRHVIIRSLESLIDHDSQTPHIMAHRRQHSSLDAAIRLEQRSPAASEDVRVFSQRQLRVVGDLKREVNLAAPSLLERAFCKRFALVKKRIFAVRHWAKNQLKWFLPIRC